MIETTCKKCEKPIAIKCWREERVCFECDRENYKGFLKRINKVDLGTGNPTNKKGRKR